jgi:ribose 5-phosphate isomerase RpiB
MIVNIWLNSEFQGGGSTSKVARMEEIDQQFRIEGKLRD